MKTHSYYHFSQFSKVKSKDLFRKLSAVHFDDYRCMQVQYACLHAQKEFMQGLYTGCFISKYMQLSFDITMVSSNHPTNTSICQTNIMDFSFDQNHLY